MKCNNENCIDYNITEPFHCMRFHSTIACPKMKIDISSKTLMMRINNLEHTNGLQRELITNLKEKLRRTESLVQSMSRELQL